MLLTTLKRRFNARNDDEGAVLIGVIAVSVIVVIICALIANSAIAASTFSATTRASLQSRAAADAGIDIVRAAMEQGTFYCVKEDTTSTGLSYSVTVEYYDDSDTKLTCSGLSSLIGVPSTGVVTSTGTAADGGVASANSGDTRTVISFLDIEVTDSTATLDKVFFSDAGYTITNSTTVSDGAGLGQANLYSNNDVLCKTTIAIQGNVYVQGNFESSNKCVISGDVWAGGKITSADQMVVSGDLMSMGGTSASPGPVDLDKAWVGGSVIANGSVSMKGNSNTAYCSVAGYNSKVCGSIISLEGGVTLDNGSNVAGNIYAKNSIDIGTTNQNLIVGGNVVSTTGSLSAKNYGNNGYRVGGWVAVGTTSQLPKARIGNQASSCATGTSGFTACSPSQPAIPLGGIPPELNFPTNTRVVAPPRESLARINSDAISLTQWVGWTIENVTCSNLNSRITAGWTGKLLLNVTNCTAPVVWDNKTFTLTGDLAIMNRSGWEAKNDLTFKSNNTTQRNLMLIVPSDAKLANGTTDLVTWTKPIATDPNYYKPTCAAGSYGDITSSKISTTKINMFIYTPCDFAVQNQLINFYGQIYSGSSVYPNNSSITYTQLDVPGAVTAGTPVASSIVATETSRFDARG
jgi:hypothetical protein